MACDGVESVGLLALPFNDVQLNLQNVTSGKLSPNFRCLALLHSNGVLEVTVLQFKGSQSQPAFTLPGVKAFTWEEVSYEEDDATCRLLTLLEGDFLEVAEISFVLDAPLLVQSFRQSLCGQITLIAEEEECASSDVLCHLLEFYSSVASLAIGRWHVVAVEVVEEKVVQCFKLNHVATDYIDLQLTNKYVFLLTEDGLSILVRENGSLLTQINIQDSLMELEPSETVPEPSGFAVSADGSRVAVTCRGGQILLFSVSIAMSKATDWQSEYSYDHSSLRFDLSSSIALDEVTYPTLSTSVSKWDSRMSLSSTPPSRSITTDELSPRLDRSVSSMSLYSRRTSHSSAGSADYSTVGQDEDRPERLLGRSRRTATSVSPWNCRLRQVRSRYINSHQTGGIYSDSAGQWVYMAPPSGELVIYQLQVDSSKVTVWYRDVAAGENSVVVMDCITGKRLQTLNGNNPFVAVIGNQFELPNLILTAEKITVMVSDASQEKLISKVMLFSNVGAAEQLSVVNEWQSLSLPLAILTVGLKNRQLDTVAFFLKNSCPSSKAGSAIDAVGKTVEGELFEGGNETTEMTDFISITSLILSVVQGSKIDANAHVFVDQVVKVTMDFLVSCLSNTDTGNEIFVGEVMKNIVALRQCLMKTANVTVENPIMLPLTGEVEGQRSELQEMMCDAIVRRRIPEAQAFCMTVDIETRNAYDSWSKIENEGVQLSLKFIQKQNWEMAIRILENVHRHS